MEPDSLEYDDVIVPVGNMESDSLEYDDMTTEDLPRLSRCPVNNGIRGLSASDIQFVCSPDLVKFLIGPSKKQYYLSKPLVASLTEILHFILCQHEDFGPGPGPGGGGVNARSSHPINWSNLIDEDIFNLFVQYAYTGGYDIPTDFPDDDILRNHQVYSEAMSKDPHAYWIYESSPFVVETTHASCPASVYRQHAQIWAFAMLHGIHGLMEVAQQQLRASLKDLMLRSSSQQSGDDDCFGLEEDRFREVVDVIGYIYHQGRQFWGKEIKAEVPLSGMRLTVAWFARKYLCDYGESHVRQQYAGGNQQNLKIWMSLLEKEPLIALDMVCHDPKTVPW